MSQLDYQNYVILESKEATVTGNSSAQVKVAVETKLFKAKYAHQENADNTGKGDDLGFTIVFGNDGERTWVNPGNIPTLEDVFTIDSPIDLKVMDLCLPCNYQLWIVKRDGVTLVPPYELKKCKVLNSGTYTFQLRKLVGGVYTPYFDIPCHSMCCFSMMFQVELPACPPCPDDCTSEPIKNGGFEDAPHNTPANTVKDWGVVVPPGGFVQTTMNSGPYSAYEGDYFALLKTDGPGNYTKMYQTIEVCPGDKIQGYAFFFGPDFIFKDNAKIEILKPDGSILNTPYTNTSFDLTGWELWEYTFKPTEGGVYTLVCEVANTTLNIIDAFLGVDAIKIIKA